MTARFLGAVIGAMVMMVVVTIVFAALACVLIGARAVSAILLAIPFAVALVVINTLRNRKNLLKLLREGL